MYTDGGASPNPGVGAWAAIIQAGNKRIELTGGELATTNNRMEMLAAISALEALEPGQQVLIYTDSQYLKNGITTWIKNWKKNNWMRGKGRDLAPVKNAELWKQLDSAVQKHRLGWEWVKGHAGNELNERCDVLCSEMMNQLEASSTKAERAAAMEALKTLQGANS
ncbi:MAG: ribonuclease HI [Sumerlaeia bacterium]